MRKWLVVLLLLCWSVPAFAQIPNHLDVVTQARKQYAELSGRQRAYCILNATAWQLRSETAGLFYKTGENSFAQRSSDILIYQRGAPAAPAGKGPTFDVLTDAEGVAKPAWARSKPTGFGSLSNWRAPVDPIEMAACPTAVVPPVDPPPVDPPPSNELETRVKALEVVVARQAQRVDELEAQSAAHGTAIADMDRRLTALALKPPVCTPGEQSTSRGGWPAHGHSVWTCIPTAAVP